MRLTLSMLRESPKSICDEYGFIVQNNLFKSDEGYECELALSYLEKNVYQLEPLEPKEGTRDWFFPYRPKVGYCQVPIGQPEGTICLTGGMNGCTLEVYKQEESFIFYHDTNGCNLHKSGSLLPGERVCHVPYKSYAGPLEIGRKQAEELTAQSKGVIKVYFEHTLICVKVSDHWNVYVTGVHTHATTTSGKVSKQYSTFCPTITSLLTSFRDS